MQGDTVPAGVITVTSVHCGKDLRDATVNVSVFGDDALKETALQHIRHHPRLTFKLDLSLERGDEVLAILDRLPQPAADMTETKDGESDPA